MAAHTVYAIGECMIELQRSGAGQGGTMDYRFGGDTLNTAVYLARLLDPALANVAYVTGVGTDGTRSRIRCSTIGSSLTLTTATAWSASGITPSRQRRIS